MRFRWRRHDRQQVAPAAHVARDETPAFPSHVELLAIVHAHLTEQFGPNGRWVPARRTDADTDVIFQESFTQALARDIADAVLPGQRSQAVSPDWKPEPITVWADPAPDEVASEASVAAQSAERLAA